MTCPTLTLSQALALVVGGAIALGLLGHGLTLLKYKVVDWLLRQAGRR